MATKVVKSIGTGGDYTTVEAWGAAIPADLVAADEQWTGELKNQEHMLADYLNLSTITQDATRYLEIVCETGASFMDQPSNGGTYDVANGAGIRQTAEYKNGMLNIGDYGKIHGVQFSADHRTCRYVVQMTGSSVLSNCLINTKSTQGDMAAVRSFDGGITQNCVIRSEATSSTTRAIYGRNGTRIRNVTVVGKFSYGHRMDGGTNYIDNTVFYGMLTGTSHLVYGATISGAGNASSLADGNLGTAPVQSMPNTAFVDYDNGDFQVAAGQGLNEAGADLSTFYTIDVMGNTRSVPWDIGGFEIAGPTGPKTVTITLVAENSTPLGNLSSLKYAFFDEATPNALNAPTVKGGGGSTDGSGVFTLDVSASSLSAGSTGYLIVSDTDGTVGQTSQKAFAGPAVVS